MVVNDMCHRAMHTDNRRDQKYREHAMQIMNNRKENKTVYCARIILAQSKVKTTDYCFLKGLENKDCCC